MKKIFTLTLLILALFTATCNAASPAEDVETLCKAIIHGDTASLKRIKMTPEEYEKQFIAAFSKSIGKSSGLELSKNQTLKLNNALMAAFRRSQFEIETVSQDDKNATVKVTISRFEKLDENLIRAYLPANFDSMSHDEKVDAFVDAMAAAIQNLKIVGYSDLECKCKYISSEKMWVPESKEFGASISNRIFTV